MKKILQIVFSVASLVLLAVGQRSFAQTASGQVIITWQANNYFPADFAGKSLPAPRTEIVASAELLQNNKLADISGSEISWFLDDEFLRSGTGLKTISFYTNQEDDGYTSVRAEIKTGKDVFHGSLQIPVVPPELVLSYRSPTNTVRANSQATFVAIPYSFSIHSLSDLMFFWSVNGERADTKENILTLNIGTPSTYSQNTVQVSVSAQNNLNSLEIAKNMLVLPIQTSQ